MKRIVYFFSEKLEIDYVAMHVYNASERLFALLDAGFTFCGKSVRRYEFGGVEFYFARTPDTLSHIFDAALAELEEKFPADKFDFAGVVNWHAGASAPPQVFCAHGVGSPVDSAFAPSSGVAIKSILNAVARIKQEYVSIRDWEVAEEATHYSGIPHNQNANNLMKWRVPQADIEIGSIPESYSNMEAASALARALIEGICEANKTVPHNVLFAGGVHFEPNVSATLNSQWTLPHVLTYPWIGADATEEELYQRLKNAADSFVDQPPTLIVFHQGAKGPLKRAARRLADELGIEAQSHKAFRNSLQ